MLGGGGGCWCNSTTVTVGFRLVFPACHGTVGVSGAPSAATTSLVCEEKPIPLTILRLLPSHAVPAQAEPSYVQQHSSHALAVANSLLNAC